MKLKGGEAMKRRYPFIVIAVLGILIGGAFFAFVKEPQAIVNISQPLASDTWLPMNQENRGNGMGGYFSGTRHDTIAEALGMTTGELQEACLNGITWEELATEKGIDMNELEQQVLDQRQKQLEDLVNEGKLTEVQKNVMLENLELNRGNQNSLRMQGKGMGMGRGQGNIGQNCQGLGNRW